MSFLSGKSMNYVIAFSCLALFLSCGPTSETSITENSLPQNEPIKPGVYDFEKLLSQIGEAPIAVVTNHTGTIGEVHLVDSLLNSGIEIKRVFAPEHGFRGDRPDGEKIEDGMDSKTGLPIVSLYGKNKKPSAEQLEDVEIVLFDIQDVGARFYTYLSTLHYVMQACAELDIPLIVTDRPNPNIHYTDGPVLEKGFESFVGLHPVPVVYGMTIGEYAQMLNGEGWHEAKKCDLTIMPCLNYSRGMKYELPVKPSPNLPDMESVYLYPSLCFFEGTEVSVGRGTESPFTIIGEPRNQSGEFSFVPHSIPGASVNPKHEGKTCIGYDLSNYIQNPSELSELDLSWLVRMYRETDEPKSFFLKSGYFDKLAGTDQLREEIINGMSIDTIRAGWQADLESFELIRSKYLIYEEE